MHRRHLALLFLLPLAFPGVGGCDSDDKTSRESGETSAAAEDTPSTNQRREAADSTEGAEEPSAPTADEQAPAPDSDAAPKPARVTASDDGRAAAQELGCTACHGATTQLVGPSYQAVAEKYDGDEAKILERIKMAVKDGASGSWNDVTGGTAMPPQPQAADKAGQLEAIAGWIAGMAE